MTPKILKTIDEKKKKLEYIQKARKQEEEVMGYPLPITNTEKNLEKDVTNLTNQVKTTWRKSE